MTDGPPTPLGELLERARTEVAGISGREAARRAGISETRWRQVVGGNMPPARTVVAMALAVEIDPADALAATGEEYTPDAIAALASDAKRRAVATEVRRPSGLAQEIERVQALPIGPEDKIRIVNALIDIYEEQAREGPDQRALA